MNMGENREIRRQFIDKIKRLKKRKMDWVRKILKGEDDEKIRVIYILKDLIGK